MYSFPTEEIIYMKTPQNKTAFYFISGRFLNERQFFLPFFPPTDFGPFLDDVQLVFFLKDSKRDDAHS